MPARLNTTNSASSWPAEARRRCRKVQSRFPSQATTVASVADRIFAVIGLVSSGPPPLRPKRSRLKVPTSTRKAIAPTAPNLTISRRTTSIASRARAISEGGVTGVGSRRCAPQAFLPSPSRGPAMSRSATDDVLYGNPRRAPAPRGPAQSGPRLGWSPVSRPTASADPHDQLARPVQRPPGGFPLVGVVGAGQLARMMHAPATALGLGLRVLSEAPDASAALVGPQSPPGHHTDLDALRRLAAECDVVTFDHEHVPPEHLRALEAAGAVVHPSSSALLHAQDKVVMRRRLSELGIPCPRWAEVGDRAALERFADEVGWPLVLKTPRGGYDGKGVLVVGSPEEAEGWLARLGPDDVLLAEEKVAFGRELAVLVARSPMGQASAWPVVETVQEDGICTEVIAPAPDLPPDLAAAATAAALRVAGELDVTGVLAVELFELSDAPAGGPAFVVNELAMRPHNSGHWTMDGSGPSQFEQHLRAV